MKITVTQMPKGYHWRAMLPNGEPVTRGGKPLQGDNLFEDAWEACTAGHSAIATYDGEHSYIVNMIVTHYGKKSRK